MIIISDFQLESMDKENVNPNSKVQFHCLSTKQRFEVDNPAIVKTKHGRYFYVAPSPYATHSKKTGKELGNMYRAVPKQQLQDFLSRTQENSNIQTECER